MNVVVGLVFRSEKSDRSVPSKLHSLLSIFRDCDFEYNYEDNLRLDNKTTLLNSIIVSFVDLQTVVWTLGKIKSGGNGTGQIGSANKFGQCSVIFYPENFLNELIQSQNLHFRPKRFPVFTFLTLWEDTSLT
ncbi:unnamed protein product [Orchesella dallaii]|uniref:Uncharacterized protein n=1 Tax=Orchesella dallaii TaxID=48710 RepID=A0ABP1Q7M1_9HEXA